MAKLGHNQVKCHVPIFGSQLLARDNFNHGTLLFYKWFFFKPVDIFRVRDWRIEAIKIGNKMHHTLQTICLKSLVSNKNTVCWIGVYCTFWPRWQYVIIVSDKDLAPNGQEPIIWRNGDPMQRYIYWFTCYPSAYGCRKPDTSWQLTTTVLTTKSDIVRSKVFCHSTFFSEISETSDDIVISKVINKPAGASFTKKEISSKPIYNLWHI